MPVRLQSLLSYSTDPVSLVTIVEATVSLIWFDPQQNKTFPFDHSTYPYRFYVQVQIIDPEDVPAESSPFVEYPGPSVPLGFTTSRGGNQKVRTTCSNEAGTLLDLTTQQLVIPTCVRRYDY